MADHDTNLRRSKRLRTESETVNRKSSPTPDEPRSKRVHTKSKKATFKPSPAPSEPVEAPNDIDLPAVAGSQADDSYWRPPYEPVEAPKDFDVSVAAGSMTARPYRSQLKDLPSPFQTDLLAFAATRDPLIASLVGREYSAHKKREKDTVATTVELELPPEAKEAHSEPLDTKSSPAPKESVQPAKELIELLGDVDLPAVAGPRTADHYLSKLDDLSDSFRLNLLAYAAVCNPHIGSMVDDEYSSEIERIKASAGSFKPYLERVYHLLNERYARLPSSLQVDLAPAVYVEIESIIDKILGEVSRSSSFEMKKGALEAIRQILYLFCKVPETLGRELKTVRPTGHDEYAIAPTWDWKLLEAVKRFTHLEMEKLGGQWGHDQGLFWGIFKLKNVWNASMPLRGLGLDRACEILDRYRYYPPPTEFDDDDDL